MKWEYQTVKLNIAGGWNLSGVDFDVDVVQGICQSVRFGRLGTRFGIRRQCRLTDNQRKSFLYSKDLSMNYKF